MEAEYSAAEEKIFEAALAVFARKGRDGARMQEIADAAGLNKALLHYYFRSKDQLYGAVFAYVHRRFMQSFEHAMEGAQPFADVLHAFIDGYVDFIADHLDVMRLMVSEQLAGGAVLREQMAGMAAADAPPRRFVERAAEAVRHGEIRPVDPFQLLLTVVSGCVFFFIAFPMVTLLHPDAATHREAFIAARKTHLFDLIYHGLQPRPTE